MHLMSRTPQTCAQNMSADELGRNRSQRNISPDAHFLVEVQPRRHFTDVVHRKGWQRICLLYRGLGPTRALSRATAVCTCCPKMHTRKWTSRRSDKIGTISGGQVASGAEARILLALLLTNTASFKVGWRD